MHACTRTRDSAQTKCADDLEQEGIVEAKGKDHRSRMSINRTSCMAMTRVLAQGRLCLRHLIRWLLTVLIDIFFASIKVQKRGNWFYLYIYVVIINRVPHVFAFSYLTGGKCGIGPKPGKEMEKRSKAHLPGIKIEAHYKRTCPRWSKQTQTHEIYKRRTREASGSKLGWFGGGGGPAGPPLAPLAHRLRSSLRAWIREPLHLVSSEARQLRGGCV